MFQKVGGWLGDREDRYTTRASTTSAGSYYTSSDAEKAHSNTQSEQPGPAGASDGMEATNRTQATHPFDKAGQSYGGRVPYRSQKDIQAQQAAMEAERQRALQQQQRAAQMPLAQQGYGAPSPQAPGTVPVMQPSPQAQGMLRQPSSQAYPQVQGVRSGNVLPFPNGQQSPNGSPYAHTEYIVLLRNRNECKNVIEYIKANASVFLNMEFIASDSERQRCVDMLSGAAYTLGCMLTKISPRGIYLISSPTVRVMVDPALQKFTTAPEAHGIARQGYDTSAYASRRQGGAYAQSPHEAVQQQATSRFSTQGSAYPQPAPATAQQRRTTGGYGAMSPGDATSPYQPAPAYPSTAPTGRLSSQEYPRQ